MQEPAIKVIAMPSDTNPDGNMFGGWIVSMMDLAGAVEARKVVRHNLVTVAIDNIVFLNPLFVGD
jgi:acyl-CoA thioesterase YciA